jgi:hypothetical protein
MIRRTDMKTSPNQALEPTETSSSRGSIKQGVSRVSPCLRGSVQRWPNVDPQRAMRSRQLPEKSEFRMGAIHKSERPRLTRLLCWYCVLAVLMCGIRADIMHRTVLPGQSLAGIDFDGDGAYEVTFTSYALTTHSLESSGTLFMKVVCAERTEVLLDAGHVLPLDRGSVLSPIPHAGSWGRVGHGSTVWAFPLTSPPPSSTNILAGGEGQGGEDLQQPMPWGVGMPANGGFMGVRFQRAEEWHYAWVHFGIREAASTWLPTLDLPSVLGFAYESVPDIAVEVGTKPRVVPITGLEHVAQDYLRIRWSAHIGRDYHIETRRRLDRYAWSPMSFRIAGVAETMMIDLPITEETQYFRVIEAD